MCVCVCARARVCVRVYIYLFFFANAFPSVEPRKLPALDPARTTDRGIQFPSM